MGSLQPDEPKQEGTPEAPKEETSETPETPKEETSETPEAPKDDNTIIVPPVDGETEQPEETTEQPAADPQEEEYLLKIHEVLESDDPEFITYWAKQLMEQEAFVNFLYLQSTDVRDAFLAKIAPYYTEQPTQDEAADQPELLAAPPQWGQDTTEHKFDFELKGIDIAYIFYYDSEQPAVNELEVNTVEGGTDTVAESSRTIAQESSKGQARVVFFIKPKDGYLLTEWEGGAKNYSVFDFYGINTLVEYTKIKGYPNLQDYVTAMRGKGYVGYYGFTLSSQTKTEYTSKLTGEKPTLEVTATTELDQVTPGKNAKFTVTIKPGVTSVNYNVEELGIGELTINGIGKDEEGGGITYGEPTPKEDGTYTLEVYYPVTSDDFERGTVELKVEASIKYKKIFEVEDRAGTKSYITTETEVSSKADETIPIVSNPLYVVIYDPDLKLSEEVEEATKAPLSGKYYKKDEPVEIKYYDKNEVLDEDNGGTWTFDGWYLNEEDGVLTNKVEEPYKMVSDQVTFYGKWTFTPNTVDVTIGKHVVGYLGDHNKTFEFTYTIEDKDGNELRRTPDGQEVEEGSKLTFTLEHGGKVVFQNVPVGAVITIEEDDYSNERYTTYYQTRSLDYDKESATKSNKIEYTVLPLETVTDEDGEVKTNNPNQILFINVKDITPDTGISMDSLPYILMLTAAGAAGILLALRRRHTYDI